MILNGDVWLKSYIKCLYVLVSRPIKAKYCGVHARQITSQTVFQLKIAEIQKINVHIILCIVFGHNGVIHTV